jgi:hypothetical protein
MNLTLARIANCTHGAFLVFFWFIAAFCCLKQTHLCAQAAS